MVKAKLWIVRERHPEHFCEAYIVRNEVPQRGYYGSKSPKNRPQWFFWRVQDLSNKTKLSKGMVHALGIKPGECFLLINTAEVNTRLWEGQL